MSSPLAVLMDIHVEMPSGPLPMWSELCGEGAGREAQIVGS